MKCFVAFDPVIIFQSSAMRKNTYAEGFSFAAVL